MKLLRQHDDLLQAAGPFSPGLLHLQLQICIELQAVAQKDQYVAVAQSRNWPTKINFSSLPDRIVAMEGELQELIDDDEARKETVVFDYLRLIQYLLNQ
jgi:hypothetical protein